MSLTEASAAGKLQAFDPVVVVGPSVENVGISPASQGSSLNTPPLQTLVNWPVISDGASGYDLKALKSRHSGFPQRAAFHGMLVKLTSVPPSNWVTSATAARQICSEHRGRGCVKYFRDPSATVVPRSAVDIGREVVLSILGTRPLLSPPDLQWT